MEDLIILLANKVGKIILKEITLSFNNYLLDNIVLKYDVLIVKKFQLLLIHLCQLHYNFLNLKNLKNLYLLKVIFYQFKDNIKKCN
jgi:hypothetical protein